MTDPSGDLGATLDRLAARAWPALETRHLDGWWLRFNEGLHRRVNSVFPESDGRLALGRRIAGAEKFYRGHHLPPRFQVSAASKPDGLDALLAARGYGVESGVDIMIADAAPLARQRGSGIEVVLDGTPGPAWLDVHMAEAPDAETKARKARMLDRIQPRHVFARAVGGGRTLSAGLGIMEDGWLGVFGMFTLAGARRRGHAHAVMAALAGWALAHGGARAYLQVERDNPAALTFYRRAGFEAVHGYHYRTLWD